MVDNGNNALGVHVQCNTCYFNDENSGFFPVVIGDGKSAYARLSFETQKSANEGKSNFLLFKLIGKIWGMVIGVIIFVIFAALLYVASTMYLGYKAQKQNIEEGYRYVGEKYDEGKKYVGSKIEEGKIIVKSSREAMELGNEIIKEEYLKKKDWKIIIRYTSSALEKLAELLRWTVNKEKD